SYIKETFSGEDAPQWGFRGDIKGCYEAISHRWMLRHIPMAEKVLREFLQAGYIFNGQMFPTDQGIGLGCALSPIIANMTLNGLQEHIYRSLGEDPKKNYSNGRIIRYSDDFIVAANDERTAKQIRYIVEEFLKDRGLVLSEEKSHVFNVRESFTFLSRIYTKSEGKLYSNPSDDAIGRFMDRMKELVDGYKGSQQQLIADINKRIDGWATYHKTNDTGTDVVFRQMDTYITGMLLTLCKKKHPSWDEKKITERYWYKDYDGQYYYSLPDKREVRVKHLSDTLFVDYSPVNVRINPYTKPEYFERRSRDRAVQSATGIFRTVWDRQDGRCYYCGKKILRDETKAVVSIDPGANRRKASSYAYVHERCTLCSVEYTESDEVISSTSDIMELLYSIKNEGAEKKTSYKYDSLREYFFSTDKLSLLLTFKEIEKISGATLPQSAAEDTFWYRGGPGAISRCWIDAGYEIKNLHTKERPRVLFAKSESAKKNEYIIIPKELVNNRIPKKAKYEMENYFKYIIKKYAL
ncbi:MAG: hypothetical protein LUD29_03340, partial [Clostridia bacterium]|nr:hypothetical protein [Clostridia bacterium]